MTRKKHPKAAPAPHTRTPAAAAGFLAAQEITTTECRGCGSQVSGVNGRYACGVCGWTNPWHEGHQDLPTAEADPDWPGRKRGS
ncbi:hypothetical protein [Streptomyces cadmiisoli]|uniref:hypothetical protein n=1 Tax=Streptomyces cadmiisoli TaxID=2184053 RepID=UPI003D70E962